MYHLNNHTSENAESKRERHCYKHLNSVLYAALGASKFNLEQIIKSSVLPCHATMMKPFAKITA